MDFIFYTGIYGWLLTSHFFHSEFLDSIFYSFYCPIRTRASHTHSKYRDVQNDQWGKSHFNWTLDTGTNYHILRTGAYPYMKYHCTKRPYQDLTLDDNFMKFIKIINLGKLFFWQVFWKPFFITCEDIRLF